MQQRRPHESSGHGELENRAAINHGEQATESLVNRSFRVIPFSRNERRPDPGRQAGFARAEAPRVEWHLDRRLAEPGNQTSQTNFATNLGTIFEPEFSLIKFIRLHH